MSDRQRIPHIVRHLWSAVLALAVVTAACGGSGGEPSGEVVPLPVIDGAGIEALISESERPLVINVWASWCIPCRSEAPLLAAAHREFGESVRFVGVAVRDSQEGAVAFLDEFAIEFENHFDRDGRVPERLGGFGVPITYFVGTDGSVTVHSGVIDERTLVLGIDELSER